MEFEPAPPVAVPPLKRRRGLRALAATAIVALVAALVTWVIIGYGVFDPGPGEPGWTPIVGVKNSHTSVGEAGLQVSQVVENDSEDTVVIEAIRGVAPNGFAATESGLLSPKLFSEYYLFAPPKLTRPPTTVEPGDQVKLVFRYRMDCLATPIPFHVPLKVLLTVSFGDVRQEVEVPDVVGIDHAQPLDPPVPACS